MDLAVLSKNHAVTVATSTATRPPVDPYTTLEDATGAKQQDLGPGETRTCPRCHNTTVWNRLRESKQFTLFFTPVARWNRREFEVCSICNEAVAV